MRFIPHAYSTGLPIQAVYCTVGGPVIKEFSEPITFDTVATAYELLEAEREQCQALELELLKSKAEVQYWKHQLGKQKQMVRSLSNQW